MPSPEPANPAKPAPEMGGLIPTKWEALKARGWWLPYDWAIVVLLAITLVTLLFWRIFGEPTATNLIAVVLVDIFIAQLWLISLVFRCSCFVLETQADINLMPEAAARIAAGYFNMSGTPNRTRKP
jgi:uncharacterized PurR-regulated membrane protein YhhQ (DUF165 family)